MSTPSGPTSHAAQGDYVLVPRDYVDCRPHRLAPAGSIQGDIAQSARGNLREDLPRNAATPGGGYSLTPASNSAASSDPAPETSAAGAKEQRTSKGQPRGPTAEQLSAVEHVFVSSHAASGRGRESGRGKGGAHGGKSKFQVKVFDPQATRPQPTLTTPMNTITVTIAETISAFTTSTSLPSYYASVFALSQFTGISAYTSLFDEYKIEFIEVWLEPSIIMSGAVGSAMFYSAIDLDDANTPASADDVSLRQGVAISETGTGHYHKWKPYVATALYSGAFTSYGSIPACWIDCASPSVQHFGIKSAVPNADGIARLYRMEIRATVSFRGPAI